MNSNLSALKFDMVTAMTAGSINASMKEYFFKHHTGSVSFYILSAYDAHDNMQYFYVSPFTLEKEYQKMSVAFPENLRKKGKALFDELESLEIWNIPAVPENRTEQDKERIRNAYDIYCVDVAIFITNGLPFSPGTQLFNEYQPVVLHETIDPQNSSADFTQVFKDCTVYEIYEHHKQVICTVVKQSDQKEIWKYKYHINLVFNEKSRWDNLTAEEKDILKKRFEISSDEQLKNMFELSTLILDLTTLEIKSLPHIDGLKQETQPKLVVAITKYIQDTQEKVMQIGHTVKPRTHNNSEYLFRPKNYTFMVSSHSSKNNELTSLNYIISFDENLPELKPINWDWVSPLDSQKGKVGVMAFNPNVFLETFLDYFRVQQLDSLRIIPKATVDIDWVSFYYDWELEHDATRDTNKFKYNNTAKKYEWSYSQYAQSTIRHYLTLTVYLKLKNDVACTVEIGEMKDNNITYPALIFKTTLKFWMDLCAGGNSRGNIYDITMTAYLGFSVDSLGKIHIHKKFEKGNNMGHVDIEFNSKVTTLGQINDMISGIKSNIGGYLDQYAENFENSFINNFLGYSNWVLPGNKSFTFSDEGFSDNNDFYSFINYVSQ